jgi:hypothetical protein
MTKNERKLLEMIKDAKDPQIAVIQAIEILKLTITYGDDFLRGGKKYVDENDQEGLIAYVEEWKAKYNQMMAGLVP